MRSFCRAVVVLALVVSLADLPAAMAANRAMGFVLAAQSSQIDGYAATNGSNVFAGDALVTNPEGRIALRFGADQIYVPASSAVTLANGKDGLMAVLSAGTLQFAAPQGVGMAVRADEVLVRPKAPAATHAQITILKPDELRIAAVAGPLELELDGETYSLAPGRTYGVRIVEDDRKENTDVNHPARRRRRLLLFLFLAAAGAAAILQLVDELHESPYEP